MLDKVFEHLELVEKDFFGLQYNDIQPTTPDAMVSDIITSFPPHPMLKKEL